MTRNSGRDRNGSTGTPRVLEAGLLILVVSVPLAVIMIRTVSGTVPSRWLFVPLPAVDLSLSLYPPLEAGELTFTGWLWGLLGDFWELVVSVVYYLVLSAVALGVTLVVGGAIGFSTPAEIAKSIRRALGHTSVKILLSLYAMAGLAITYPERSRIALEIGVTGFLWIAVMLAVLAIWMHTDLTDHPLTRVGIWYPLTIAIVVLPSVVVAVASPSLYPGFVRVTETLWTLVSASDVPLGVPTATIAAHDIPPIVAFGVFWVGFILATGWLLGAVTELVIWLPRRIARVSLRLWGRSARFIRELFHGS